MTSKKREVWTNEKIAKLLRSVAAAYQIKGGKKAKFKAIAYDRAATAIEHSTSEVKDLWDDGQLNQLSGIGPSIAQHLDELFRTGRVKHFETVLANLPPAMFELIQVKGIGPRTAFKLCQALGIRKAKNALKRLEEAARDGEIRRVAGFGPDSEAKILRSIKRFIQMGEKKKRMLLVKADIIAQELINYLIL